MAYKKKEMNEKQISHKILRSKHNNLCKLLAEEIKKRYDYDSVETNVLYKLGENDVLVKSFQREVYHECKYNHTNGGYIKAIDQTLRWTQYMKQHYPQKDYYGVYHTKTLTKLICKNGYKR